MVLFRGRGETDGKEPNFPDCSDFETWGKRVKSGHVEMYDTWSVLSHSQEKNP